MVAVPIYLDEEDYIAQCVLEFKGEISFEVMTKPITRIQETTQVGYDLSGDRILTWRNRGLYQQHRSRTTRRTPVGISQRV